jgi:hypothetical protein
MRPPLPEAIDKFSILSLKLERGHDPQQLISVRREWEFYKAVIEEYRKDNFEVKDTWIKALKKINGRIWDLEATIHNEGELLSLEEIGRRTLEIRNINRERIESKNKIAEEIGMDFFEVKIDHLFQ